jgi:hypothetical protein
MGNRKKSPKRKKSKPPQVFDGLVDPRFRPGTGGFSAYWRHLVVPASMEHGRSSLQIDDIFPYCLFECMEAVERQPATAFLSVFHLSVAFFRLKTAISRYWKV